MRHSWPLSIEKSYPIESIVAAHDGKAQQSRGEVIFRKLPAPSPLAFAWLRCIKSNSYVVAALLRCIHQKIMPVIANPMPTIETILAPKSDGNLFIEI